MVAAARQSLERFLREAPAWTRHGAADGGPRAVLRSAQGVLDVLGGLNADSGGTLAQLPLPTQVAIALRPQAADHPLTPAAEPVLRLINTQFADHAVEYPLGRLIGLPQAQAAAAIAELGSRTQPEGAWAAAIVALFWQVQSAPRGADIVIHSDIPAGAGQASSTSLLSAIGAALAEVENRANDPLAIAQWAATAHALAAHPQSSPSAPVLPARIDIINSLTSLHPRDKAGAGGPPVLLRYSAQPPRLVGPVRLPRNLRILALDTGVRNTSAQPMLDELAIAAAMGTRIIETIYRDLGQPHAPLHGSLANTSPLLYRQYFRALLPRRLRGSDFVRTYGPLPESLLLHGDLTDESDAARLYRVRTAVDHFIAENEHAEQFLQAMEELADTESPAAASPSGQMDEAERQRTLQRAGRLLLASHHSYRLRLELSCREADWLVDRLMEAGPDHGIYGARITGPAAGGTLAVLSDRSARATEALLQIKKSYGQFMGLPLSIIEA